MNDNPHFLVQLPPDLLNADTALQLRKAVGLLTEDEIAKALLLNSTDTLATWRSQKKGPKFVKLGKRVFYAQQDFVEWIVEERRNQHAANDNKPAGMAA